MKRRGYVHAQYNAALVTWRGPESFVNAKDLAPNGFYMENVGPKRELGIKLLNLKTGVETVWILDKALKGEYILKPVDPNLDGFILTVFI